MALVTRPIEAEYRAPGAATTYKADSDTRFYIYDDVRREYLAEIRCHPKAMGLREDGGKPKGTGFGLYFEVRLMKQIDLRSGGEAFFEVSHEGVTKRVSLAKKIYPVSSDLGTSYQNLASTLKRGYEFIGLAYFDRPNFQHVSSLEYDVRTNFFDRTQGPWLGQFGRKGKVTISEYSEYAPYISKFTTPIGSQVSLTLKNVSITSANRFKLSYYWYGKQGTIMDWSSNQSSSWTLPSNFWDDIPDNFSGTGYIRLEARKDNDGYTHTIWIPFIGEIPSHIKPTITTLTLTDTNAKVHAALGSAAFAQGLSNIRVNASGNGIYGSSIQSIRVEIVGRNQSTTTNGGTLGPMAYHGQVTIRATVTDSRGRTSEPMTRTVTVLPYHNPILSFTVARGGTQRDQLVVTRTVKVAPLTWNGRQNNRLKLDFQTAPYGGSFSANNSSANVDSTTMAELVNSQATLAGTFSSLSSFEVLGSLSDNFNGPVTFKDAAPTERYSLTYDRSGVGINKARERGALDVGGDIYANNNPIQQWQLTGHSGRSLYNASRTVDLNTKLTNSFFSCNESSNGPNVGSGLSQFFVSVYSESDNFLAQNAIQKNTGRMFTRTRHGGIWTPWVEYAQADNPGLVQVGWTSTGVSGVHYKRDGSVVALRINVTATNYVSNFSLGKIPTTLLPIAGVDSKFPVIAQNTSSSSLSYEKVVTIDRTGSCTIGNYLSINETLKTTLTWLI